VQEQPWTLHASARSDVGMVSYKGADATAETLLARSKVNILSNRKVLQSSLRMPRARILKNAWLVGFLALACLIFGGGSRATAQIIDCTGGSPGPNMTIVIYNNSS